MWSPVTQTFCSGYPSHDNDRNVTCAKSLVMNKEKKIFD